MHAVQAEFVFEVHSSRSFQIVETVQISFHIHRAAK